MSEAPTLGWPGWESYAAAPLYGVELAPGVGAAAPGLVFGSPGFETWLLLEKTGITRDPRLVEAYWRRPPVYAVVRLPERTRPAGSERELLEAPKRELDDLVLALRLIGSGPLADPMLTALYLRDGYHNVREVGMYREHFIGREFDPPYRLDAGGRALVEAWIARLRALRVTPHGGRAASLGSELRHALPSPIEFGEDRFSDPRFRITGAFTVLESIFGRSSQSRAGRSFAGRIASAVGPDLGGGVDVEEAVESRIVPLRDRLIHGSGAGLEVSRPVLDLLVEICRRSVARFLEFLAEHPTRSPAEAEKGFNARCAATGGAG